MQESGRVLPLLAEGRAPITKPLFLFGFETKHDEQGVNEKGWPQLRLRSAYHDLAPMARNGCTRPASAQADCAEPDQSSPQSDE
ncbi:hypothetical protein LHFGNBLO_001297 [Mesorhizobium sp. AR10]|uniref:hypothetical protein n=1 Tax=Mesorhizobium sp. AR10 TaxID=2865839 RepID=UPI00216092CC|nr:hypothetical protein [Mesorhizobium sp. AR10]UVK39884.1 hypothetical protein LHFGNBLO_001297 [Mesorhizobium sp. AR10]